MTTAESRIAEHHLTVARTARYCTLGNDTGPAHELWIVCHGFAQLARTFVEEFRTIAGAGRLIIAPEALNRFYLNREAGRAGASARVGATWMTREDRLAEIDDYVRYLDQLYREVTEGQRRDVRVTALGFSQGTATVARWLVHGTARIDRLVLWAGLLPPEIDASGQSRDRLRSVELVLVRGTRDEMLDVQQLQAQRESLEGAGARVTLLEFDGGHRMDRDTLARIAG